MLQAIGTPFINTFMLGMPHTLKALQGSKGQALKVGITGKSPAFWYLVREEGRWNISESPPVQLTASLKVPASIAWKLFSKSVRPAAIMSEVIISGDEALAKAALGMVSVMA